MFVKTWNILNPILEFSLSAKIIACCGKFTYTHQNSEEGVRKKVLFKYLQQIALAQCSSRLTWKWGLGKWHVSDDKIHTERTPQSLTANQTDPKNRELSSQHIT